MWTEQFENHHEDQNTLERRLSLRPELGVGCSDKLHECSASLPLAAMLR